MLFSTQYFLGQKYCKIKVIGKIDHNKYDNNLGKVKNNIVDKDIVSSKQIPNVMEHLNTIKFALNIKMLKM